MKRCEPWRRITWSTLVAVQLDVIRYLRRTSHEKNAGRRLLVDYRRALEAALGDQVDGEASQPMAASVVFTRDRLQTRLGVCGCDARQGFAA